MAPFGVPNRCPLNGTPKGATWHLIKKVPYGTRPHGTSLGAMVAPVPSLAPVHMAPLGCHGGTYTINSVRQHGTSLGANFSALVFSALVWCLMMAPIFTVLYCMGALK